MIRIIPMAGASCSFDDYRNLLNRKMAGELVVSIEIVDSIPMTPRGKRKLVDQRLDLRAAVKKLEC